MGSLAPRPIWREEWGLIKAVNQSRVWQFASLARQAAFPHKRRPVHGGVQMPARDGIGEQTARQRPSPWTNTALVFASVLLSSAAIEGGYRFAADLPLFELVDWRAGKVVRSEYKAVVDPVLGWTLRDIPTVSYETAVRDQTVPRLLVDAPSQTTASQDTVRIIGAYSADWSSLSLQPGRLWRWVANRESLVSLKPYGIVVAQPVGR